MLEQGYIKSAFELLISNRVNKSPKNYSCVQKYLKSLPVGYYHSYPYTVSLKVTANCNLRCKHCFYSGDSELYNSVSDSKKEDIFKLIDFLADELNIINLTLTGGETFLRKDFLDIVKYAKGKDLPLVIQTNGILVNEEIALCLNELLYKKSDIIHISIDGADEKSHDYIRGNGTFNKTINAVKLLRKYNLPIQINTCLTSINAPTMQDIFSLSQKLGVNRLSISRFHVCNEQHRYLDLSPEDIVYYSYQVFQEMKKYPGIHASVKIADIFDFLRIEGGREILDAYLEKNPPKSLKNQCLSCHNHNKIVISANGNVFLCSTYEAEDTNLGNLYEQDFYEIWDNRFNTPYFQKRDLTTTKCKNCKYITLCGTGCLASAYKKYGDINYAPAECSYFEEYLKVQHG